MDLYEMEGELGALAVRCGRAAPELVRRISVSVLNVARRWTPPNDAKRREGATAAVKRLRERIREDLQGGGKPASAVPGNGPRAWALQVQGATSYAGFRFVVPRGRTAGRNIIFEDPGVLVKKRRFKRTRGGVRARAVGQPGGFVWVRPGDLRRVVRKVEEQAGETVGMWYGAAASAGASNLGQFRPNKRGRVRGRGVWKVSAEEALFRGVAEAEDLIVVRRFVKDFDVWVPRWAEGARKMALYWYFKTIGLEKEARKYRRNAQ